MEAPAVKRLLGPLLAAAVLIAAGAMLFYLQRDTTFYRDEWSFVLYRQGQSLDNYLAPHAGNLALLPALLYVGMFNLFGLDDPEVIRVIQVGATLVCAWLLYRWARRRVSRWVAVLPMVSLLSFGPGWNDLLWPFQLGYFIPLAAGIGALMLLERDQLRLDVAAAALVAIAVAAGSIGLAFVAGALAMALARRRRQPWTLVLLAFPALAWFAWYRAYATADARFHPSNLAKAPELAFDSASAAMGGLTALGATAGSVLLLALAGLVIRRIASEGRPSPAMAGPIVFGVAFWALISLAPIAGSQPDESRYLLPGAVAILMIGSELLRGIVISRGWCVTILGVFALVTVSNLANLRNAAVPVRGTSMEAKAELAAIEVAGPELVPGYQADVSEFVIDGAAYLNAVRHWSSSPAANVQSLPSLSRSQRTAFDSSLLAAEGIAAVPTTRPPRSTGCAPIPPGGSEVSAPSSVVVVAGPRPVPLDVRRLGSTPTTLTRLSRHRAAAIRLPRDRLARPWTISTGPGASRACLIARG